MDVKEAVRIAKRHFSDVFSGEGVGQPTLEEVWFEPVEDAWYVTLGLRRSEQTAPFGLATGLRTYYKTVKVADKDGHPVWIKNATAA